MAPTLSRAERRLHQRVKALLSSDEELKAAIIIWTGQKRWMVGLEALLDVLLGMHPGRPGGSYFTLAVTSQGVIRFRNRGVQRPDQLLYRYDLGQLQVVTGKWGEISVELDGRRYSTLEGGGELGRVQRLLKPGG